MINGDDYAVIDAGFNAQDAPFSQGAALQGVTAVPEPGVGVMLASMAMMGAMRRRARRR